MRQLLEQLRGKAKVDSLLEGDAAGSQEPASAPRPAPAATPAPAPATPSPAAAPVAAKES